MHLRGGGDANDWVILAMIRWQQGAKGQGAAHGMTRQRPRSSGRAAPMTISSDSATRLRPCSRSPRLCPDALALGPGMSVLLPTYVVSFRLKRPCGLMHRLRCHRTALQRSLQSQPKPPLSGYSFHAPRRVGPATRRAQE